MPEPPFRGGWMAALAGVNNLVQAIGCDSVFIGGAAVSLIATPRYTQDIDLMALLETEDIPRVLEVAAEHDLVSRISGPIEFGEQARVVLLRHEPTQVSVDLALGALPFEREVIKRSFTIRVGGLDIRIPTPEDLIIMKAVAHRPKDMEDIRSILSAHPRVDVKRIEDWVRQFAEAVDAPSIWDDLAAILA